MAKLPLSVANCARDAEIAVDVCTRDMSLSTATIPVAAIKESVMLSNDTGAGRFAHAWRRRILAGLATVAVGTVLLLSGCAANSVSAAGDRARQTAIELPLVHGWYEGKITDYVTTDVSTQSMALASNANYAPRLANLLSANQPHPNPHSAVARIYKFLNYAQPSVLPTAPGNLGADDDDVAEYSPLWEVFGVTWQTGHPPRELRSEDEVLKAQDAGEVVVASLNVIVNCSVVRIGDQFLPQTRLVLH
jgi:hypothetical protein